MANAVKEMVQSIKNPVKTSLNPDERNVLQVDIKRKTKKRNAIIAGGLMILFALIYAGSQYLSSSKEEPAVMDKSIAILPFSDMSPGHDQEYFGDGMADEIINVLAQVEGLKVIARSSSFQFKGKNPDIHELGEQLGVATVLEGSVRKNNNRIKVTAQLIRVSDGSHFWSKTFEEPADDVFRIQDEIASAIASKLQVTLQLSPAEVREIPWNEEAKRLYQEGRYFFDRDAPGDKQRAFDRFSKSVALDSTHAISISYLSSSGSEIGDGAHYDKFAKIAIDRDPTVPEPHALEALHCIPRFDFDQANRQLQLALKYGKSSPQALRIVGRIYSSWGWHEDAIRYLNLALELDPLQSRSLWFLGIAYYRNGDYKLALLSWKKYEEITTRPLTNEIVFALLKDNRALEALDETEKSDKKTLLLPFVYAKLGQKEKADSVIDLLIKTHSIGDVYYLALWNANHGNPDEAFRYLEKSFGERSEWLAESVLTDPFLDPIRSDPRWKPFIKKMNFPRKDQN